MEAHHRRAISSQNFLGIDQEKGEQSGLVSVDPEAITYSKTQLHVLASYFGQLNYEEKGRLKWEGVNPICVLCKVDDEDRNHLFFT